MSRVSSRAKPAAKRTVHARTGVGRPRSQPNKEPSKEGFRRLAPAERRAQIIEVAALMFGERPYAELSVREVAQAAGVTDNLVYHYFPNKEALFIAAFEQRADDLLAASLPDPGASPFEQLDRAVRGYLDFVEAHSTAYQNLFRGSNASEAHVQALCERTRQRIVERYLEGLGVSKRSVPTTRLALRGYIGFVEETVLRWLAAPTVARRRLERLIFSVAGSTLIAGLEMDGAFPTGGTAESFRRAYRGHFALP